MMNDEKQYLFRDVQLSNSWFKWSPGTKLQIQTMTKTYTKCDAFTMQSYVLESRSKRMTVYWSVKYVGHKLYKYNVDTYKLSEIRLQQVYILQHIHLLLKF
jgi:hypothetical protein